MAIGFELAEQFLIFRIQKPIVFSHLPLCSMFFALCSMFFTQPNGLEISARRLM